MNNFPYYAQRIFNVPVAILPQKAEIIVSSIAERLGITKVYREDGAAIGAIASQISASNKEEKGYDVQNGIAIIPISGTLVHKHGYLKPTSGMTGYDGIRHNFQTALEDASVRAIAFDIDSPGGEVAGAFDLVDTIHEARGEKPMMAILSEFAYSAAYAIASAADVIAVPRTGGVGSVGVVAVHIDYSKALQESGLKVTMIQYGKRKTDAAEVKPLTDDARDRLQADVNAMGELFVETVARNRGIAASKVRNTEASTFLGAAGVAVGFADRVMSPHEAFEILCETIR